MLEGFWATVIVFFANLFELGYLCKRIISLLDIYWCMSLQIYPKQRSRVCLANAEKRIFLKKKDFLTNPKGSYDQIWKPSHHQGRPLNSSGLFEQAGPSFFEAWESGRIVVSRTYTMASVDPKTALVTQIVTMDLPTDKLNSILLDDRPGKYFYTEICFVCDWSEAHWGQHHESGHALRDYWIQVSDQHHIGRYCIH